MKQAEAKISILMATYQRTQMCERSLLSIFAAIEQTPNCEFDLVIGVNGPDRETKAMLARLRHHKNGGLLHIHLGSQRQTPAACRNELLQFTRGEWIYFLDDDAYVDPDFFQKFTANPLRGTCAAIGGPNLNPPESDFFQMSCGQALASRFATYFSSARYTPRGPLRLCSEEALILCNLFVRRDVLNQDSFLETLISAEENWMLQTLKLQRHQFSYDPYLYVWHERRPNMAAFIRQVFKYGFGRGQLFRRRPAIFHWAYAVPLFCLLYTAALLATLPNGSLPSPLWLIPFPLYAALCLIFAAAQRNLASAILFPVIHVSYGWGLFLGIFRG